MALCGGIGTAPAVNAVSLVALTAGLLQFHRSALRHGTSIPFVLDLVAGAEIVYGALKAARAAGYADLTPKEHPLVVDGPPELAWEECEQIPLRLARSIRGF